MPLNRRVEVSSYSVFHEKMIRLMGVIRDEFERT